MPIYKETKGVINLIKDREFMKAYDLSVRLVEKLKTAVHNC